MENKNNKRLPGNSEFAGMRHGDVILTLQLRHGSTCDQRAANIFLIFPTGFVRVCEVELSHMGKNDGNSDLVCERQTFSFINRNINLITYGVPSNLAFNAIAYLNRSCSMRMFLYMADR